MSNEDQRSVLMKDPKFALESAKGEFTMAATEAICEALEKNGVDRKELAKKMGVTETHVSWMLNEGDIDLRTFAEMAYHLGVKPSITVEWPEEY